MGGYGSGWHRGARQTVGDALTYTVKHLVPLLRDAERAQADGRLGAVTRGTCTWSSGGEERSRIGFAVEVERGGPPAVGPPAGPPAEPGPCGLTLVLDYRVRDTSVSLRVPLDVTAVFRTGRHYWMRCPACARRCAKLHLPSGALRFACRRCHDLTYQSCQESGKFDALFRSIANEMGSDPAAIKRLLNRRSRF